MSYRQNPKATYSFAASAPDPPLAPPPAYNPHTNTGNVRKFENAQMAPEQAAGRDYVLVIDASGSMLTEDCPNDSNRWQEASEGAAAFASTMDRLDPDGIDLCFFNDGATWEFNVHHEQVIEAFSKVKPRGGTLLAPVLSQIFTKWFDLGRDRRPVTVVVVTDGMPQDKQQVLETIVAISNRLANEDGKDEDIGISFIQIGYDKGAASFLKELDDDLQDKYGAPFDLVDTVPMSQVAAKGGIRKVLLAAVTD
jgi:Mg-chelatase subunit ChlD